MKKKALNYLLIFLATGVWGIILYRIYAATSLDDAMAPTASYPVTTKLTTDDHTTVNDTATLVLNYRDPFSTQLAPDTNLHKKSGAKVLPLSSLNARPVINWSAVKYSGYMRNPANKKLLAILSVNGKNIMLAEGEQAEQVKLLHNWGDSVKITYQGTSRYIRLN